MKICAHASGRMTGPKLATVEAIGFGTVFFFTGRPKDAPVYESLREPSRLCLGGHALVSGTFRRVWPNCHSDVSALRFLVGTEIVIVKP